MVKFKKVIAAITAVQFLLLFSLSAVHTLAAVRTTPKPSLKMVSQPVTEYKPGDKITFTVNSPNYGGKVEYRVILWNGTTKKQSELWKTSKTGYYYKGWQPAGNYKFAIHWSAKDMEPGAYSLTVLVRRVGAKVSYDSYVKTKTFWVKPGLQLSNSYYVSENNLFKMKFPSEFVVDETIQSGMDLAVAARADEQLPAFLVLTTPTQQEGSTDTSTDTSSLTDADTSLPVDVDPSSLKDEILNQLNGHGVTLTEVSAKEVALENQGAYLVEYDLSGKIAGVQQKVKVLGLITANESNTNIVIFVTTDKDWAANSTVYKQSVMSFVPTITPAATSESSVN